jgi:glutathione S-transferase
MLTLRTSPATPFGRKISMALGVIGMTDAVQCVNADTLSDTDSLRQQNPLGKIPTLLLDDGEAVYDSAVIIEYLNQLDGRNLLIPAADTAGGLARMRVQRMQALADGLIDACILVVYEARFRPVEHHVQKWLDHQQGKIARSLAVAEVTLSTPTDAVAHIGEITLACALGYMDFRFAGSWRAGHPQLVAWLDHFAAKTPSYAATMPR